MRQIAKQEHGSKTKKNLSIEQISPQWARLLPLISRTDKQEFYTNGQQLDISDCKFCVVGEAYGFSDDYSHNAKGDFCYDCYACAINFGYSLMLNPSEREGLTNTFVDHWNASHV